MDERGSQLFRRYVKGPNFVTPNIIRRDKLENHKDTYFEISTSHGGAKLNGIIPYGLTIVTATGIDHDRSSCGTKAEIYARLAMMEKPE